ncbi:phosphotransferase family protein [Spirilliplanes yamanashiensis]|uniref:Aminoglycoside phosphotransferase domain-containing protein n=1 Tax=Spirilliplanes yamanashiensis TaxID=42233 RepID=A0A8J3YB01_9ACTN|nr:aminoglycoside phosphotransferase family protein [Spirilliplanes yamanashiensis]MDP9818753.1 hypothetical protein [Spirilliplanes yamanashiensis]GIJ05208.1 hypothetical protein Sya03_45600 [Spirilliplanes yamanashiensis]
MGRTVTLVLVDDAGVPLGALPPFKVQTPWWQEVGDVVAGARLRYGVDVDVLRLVDAEQAAPPGGPVTYAAQLRSGRPDRLLPVPMPMGVHPARAAYAHPNGPRASVDWAAGQLAGLGRPDVTAVQLRTWNLSAIWRLDARGRPVAWLKQVPPFYEHEAAVLRAVADAQPGIVPRVLASGEHGRILLADVEGTDRYGADAGECAAIAADWHPVQVALADRVDKLLAHGVPDRRDPVARIRQVAATRRIDVPGLAELVDGLDRRLGKVAECGLPDTLVHGDLHPGNVRSGGQRRVLLDWGDAGVTNPAYDVIRLTEGLAPAGAEEVVHGWALRWRADAPGSVPERAVDLLRPVAQLRAAVTYADFLGAIEPSERPYHAGDVLRCLQAAVTAARAVRP